MESGIEDILVKWQFVIESAYGRNIWRLKIMGGWLLDFNNQLLFIEDPNHQWDVDQGDLYPDQEGNKL